MQPQDLATAGGTASLPEEESLQQWLREASHAETIETVIYSLESENVAERAPNEYLWRFPYGSVRVFVQLTGESDDDTLKVWAEVMVLPEAEAQQTKLMQRILAMNWAETFEANFALFGNRVVVLAHRTVADLSPEEISRAITLVATLADDWDEALIAEFGGTPIQH